jgi:DNA mismatch endonuclease (patch repair protein)
MTDNLSPGKRSILMSRVRGKNTAPEMLLRSALHRAGYRYSLHRKDLPGKPDIVFSSRRKVVFIHGCYWHGHENCNQGGLAKSNQAFWTDKLAKNRARDRRVTKDLKAAGWQVCVVWTCSLRSIRKISDTIARVTRFLES